MKAEGYMSLPFESLVRADLDYSDLLPLLVPISPLSSRGSNGGMRTAEEFQTFQSPIPCLEWAYARGKRAIFNQVWGKLSRPLSP